MKIISISLQNFASYESLEFDFTSQGLTLVQGPTGSGKSTLCDAIPWILFATTAKGGAVGEVLSWPGDKKTEGRVVIEMQDGDSMWVTRTRGAKAKDNDLVYYINGVWEHPKRGKDLNDTQRLINEKLGITPELYLAGSYYHEFSQTAQFFTTTAKHRRALCEQLVDLSLPKRLQESSSLVKKAKDKELDALERKEQSTAEAIESYKGQLKQLILSAKSWNANAIIRKAGLLLKSNNFESDQKAKIELLEAKIEVPTCSVEQVYLDRIKDDISDLSDTKCKECGAKKHSEMREKLKDILAAGEKELAAFKHKVTEQRSLKQQIDQISTTDNIYLEQYNQVEVNPYKAQVKTMTSNLTAKQSVLAETKHLLALLAQEIADLELLTEVVTDFRSVLIKNTITTIEDETNRLLNTHFDAEIRVRYSVQDADKLEAEITKSGNSCTFTQLSKGQRQLLKLCFGVAVMKGVANHHGLSFSQLFFDEALDSLDDTMRGKAFNLLQALSLEYGSIFVVDHSEALKSLFVNKFSVALVDGYSVLTED